MIAQAKKDEANRQAHREFIYRDYQHFCDLLWLECERWMEQNPKAMALPSGMGPYDSFWRLQSRMIQKLGMLEMLNTALLNKRHVTFSISAFGRAVATLAMYAMMSYSRRRRDVASKVAARMKRSAA